MPVNPKVKVPAVVGTIVTIALAALTGAADVPAAAPFASGAITLLQFASGWLTYSD